MVRCGWLIAFTLAMGFSTEVKADLSSFDLKATPAKGAVLDKLKSDVEVVIAALQASREQLRRAHFKLTDYRVEGTDSSQVVFDIESSTSFDRDKHLLRVECHRTRPTPLALKFTYIENSKQAFFYNHQGIFNILNPGYLKSHDYPPINIDHIGIGLYYNYLLRGQQDWQGFDFLKKIILEQGRLVGLYHKNRNVIIDYFADESQLVRFQVTLDESRDFVPLSVEVISFDKTLKVWREEQSTKTTWGKVEGIWLPETLASTLDFPPRQLALRFQWLSVNKEFDETLFTRESISLPKGTYIADSTLKPDRSVLVEIVGRPTGSDYLNLKKRRSSSSRRWLLGTSTGILIFAAYVIVARRRRA